jgi:hypothetical protein
VEFVDDSDKVRLGDEMFVIGNPLNSGAGVVKYSILGAKEHNVQIGKANRLLCVLSDSFSTGYVGGAVYVKNCGLFSGIIANIDEVETRGYTFVVPSNVVLEIAEALAKTNSSTSYGYIEGNYYLGATYEDSKLSSTQYVYISNIDQTGCLYLGGLRELDKITRIAYIPKDVSKEEFIELMLKNYNKALKIEIENGRVVDGRVEFNGRDIVLTYVLNIDKEMVENMDVDLIEKIFVEQMKSDAISLAEMRQFKLNDIDFVMVYEGINGGRKEVTIDSSQF